MTAPFLILLALASVGTALFGAPRDEDILTPFFQEKVDAGRIAGVHAIIAKNGQLAYSKAFGYSEIETQTRLAEDGIYRIASMTKIVTAIAALQLWEQGKFALDEPVSVYLADFKKLRVFKAAKPGESRSVETEPMVLELTIRDLFRHTAGIWGGKRYTDAGLRQWQGTLADFVQRLSSIPLDTQPSTRFQYGYSMDVIGLLVEKWSGQALDDYFRQHIFEPLRMEDTGFVVASNKVERLVNHYESVDGKLVCRERSKDSPFRTRAKALSGGGGWDYSYPGLVSTPQDWLIIMEVLRCHGTFHGTRILKESTVKMMCSDQLGRIPGITSSGLTYGLGVGVVRDGATHGKGASTGTIYWAGAPHNTFFFVDFRKGLSAALFMQSGPWGLDDMMNQFWEKTEQMFGSMQEDTNQFSED